MKIKKLLSLLLATALTMGISICGFASEPVTEEQNEPALVSHSGTDGQATQNSNARLNQGGTITLNQGVQKRVLNSSPLAPQVVIVKASSFTGNISSIYFEVKIAGRVTDAFTLYNNQRDTFFAPSGSSWTLYATANGQGSAYISMVDEYPNVP